MKNIYRIGIVLMLIQLGVNLFTGVIVHNPDFLINIDSNDIYYYLIFESVLHILLTSFMLWYFGKNKLWLPFFASILMGFSHLIALICLYLTIIYRIDVGTYYWIYLVSIAVGLFVAITLIKIKSEKFTIIKNYGVAYFSFLLATSIGFILFESGIMVNQAKIFNEMLSYVTPFILFFLVVHFAGLIKNDKNENVTNDEVLDV